MSKLTSKQRLAEAQCLKKADDAAWKRIYAAMNKFKMETLVEYDRRSAEIAK